MILLTLAAAAAPLLAQSEAPSQAPPVITVEGQAFATWQEYTSSHLFRQRNLRCRTAIDASSVERSPSHCSYGQTVVRPEYDPVITYRIPVVVHVIRDSSGNQGRVTAAKVQSQIDVLNEDFSALPGTNGAPGTDARIEFYLATVDPSGNPTNGITTSNNSTWFNDGGNYWNSLAWDTNRYLNIYTNQASGALGYVPDLPQGGIAGSKSDRVVILWSSFGRNGPIGPPYNKGRTTTHEVGHYLGLYHTFDNGCGSVSGCSTTGDRICDTNPESSPVFGCPGSRSTCGSPDPYHNYMDYSDDLCMWEFTPDQVNRMRCSLENWRPNVFAPSGAPPSSRTLFGSGVNFPGFIEQSPASIGTSWLTSVAFPPGATVSYLAVSAVGETQVPAAAGELLILPPFLAPPVIGLGNHSVTIPFDASLLGVKFWAQAASAAPLRLQNGIEITVGI